MHADPQGQQTLVDLTLFVSVLAAVGVGLLSLLAGDSVRSVVIKASVTMLGVGVLGWLVALAATPAWFKATPDDISRSPDQDERPR